MTCVQCETTRVWRCLDATFHSDRRIGQSSSITPNGYVGIITIAELYAANLEQDDGTVIAKDLAKNQQDTLLPKMNAKEAAAIFDQIESEELAVIDALDTRKVVGLLTESHTLRRYSEELDRRRQEESGWL